MTRFVLTYDPLIGKHRLDDPTKDITNRTRGRLEDDAAEWLAATLKALDMQTRNCPKCKGTGKSVDAFTWLTYSGKEEPEPTDCRWCRDGRAALKGDRHD